MNNNEILIIGSGGREHAIGWAIRKSPEAGRLLFAPGNAGTALLENAENIPIAAENVDELVRFTLQRRPALVVVGPEVPLALGLADRLRGEGLPVFGPGAAGARLEASKSWAKSFMQRHNIPTAALQTFDTFDTAATYLQSQPGPYVVKADGLAAGKGVLVTSNREEANRFALEALGGDLFGKAGNRILVEEFMEGVEISALAFCDTVSKTIIPLEPACDYKRAYDGDQGLNTGGMGAYSPPAFMTPALRKEVYESILLPTLQGLVSEGIDYRGIVYAGLMLTAQGPKVIEYNCRFGDPETQSLLPRLDSDLLELLTATANGKLASVGPVRWKEGASVGVVLVSAGYPGPYRKAMAVSGLEKLAELPDVFLFHAGTSFDNTGQVVTSGGRVFNMVAVGPNIALARQRVYNILGQKLVDFEEMRYRSDIAAREV
ncbi:MAG TPA: phosphoribosylamine--glycine ligase [Chloroflexia bacterium]|nr:phosphoribosylamine--glycine ligase [Chloroflexia bacterium]